MYNNYIVYLYTTKEMFYLHLNYFTFDKAKTITRKITLKTRENKLIEIHLTFINNISLNFYTYAKV